MKSIAATDETQALRCLVLDSLHSSAGEPTAAEHDLVTIVDTPLVLIAELPHFTVYWAPELHASVIRVSPRPTIERYLNSAIDLTRELLQDTGSRRVILDLSEVPGLCGSLARAPWSKLLPLTDERVLITGEVGAPTGWDRVSCFAHASSRLRAAPAVGHTDETAELLSAQGAVLIGGSYSGCVYWLPRLHVIAFVWGGHDADQHGARLLYAAALAYTRYFRIEAVVVDLSHRINGDTKGRCRLQGFIESAVCRGAKRCVLVAETPIKQEDTEESLEDYVTGLTALIRRVETVRTFSGALERCLERGEAGQTGLDS